MRTPSQQAADRIEESGPIPQLDRSFLDSLFEGIVIHNKHGDILLTNKAAENILGITLHQLQQADPLERNWQIIQEDGSPFPTDQHPFMLTLRTGKPCHNVIMGIRKPDGLTSWISINSQAGNTLPNGKPAYVTCSFVDITNERQATIDYAERLRLEEELVEKTLLRKREIVKAIIKAQEKERTYIAHELHDNVNQLLATTRLYVDLASRSEDNLELLAESKGLLDKAIAEVRSLSHNLTPAAFEEKGLFLTITEMTEKLNQLGKVPVRLCMPDFTDLEELLQPDLKTAIYRIIQEHLNNILKHARASLILISFHQQDHCLHLEINDNGIGFDVNTIKRGLGVNNIQSRVSLFGGTMQLQSEVGNGCTLKVSLPLTDDHLPAKHLTV